MIYKLIFDYTKVHSSNTEIYFYLYKSTLHRYRIIFSYIKKYVPAVQKSIFIYKKYVSEFPNRTQLYKNHSLQYYI